MMAMPSAAPCRTKEKAILVYTCEEMIGRTHMRENNEDELLFVSAQSCEIAANASVRHTTLDELSCLV